MNIQLLIKGNRYDLYIISDISNNVQKFIDKLEQKPKDKILALLKVSADSGPPQNEYKFKYLKNTNDIYEFKSYQIRIFCFFENDKIILTNCCIKKSRKTPKDDLERAKQLKENYLVNKG